MRERIGALLRSTVGRVIAVPVLAGGVVVATQLIGDGDNTVTANAGGEVIPEPGTVAETAEEAMQIAIRSIGVGKPPPGEECRKVTVGEIEAAWRANPDQEHNSTFGWVVDAPDELRVWVCPLLFPPNGRGVSYVAAEPSSFEIGGGEQLYQLPPLPDGEPSPTTTTTTAAPPPVNEVQLPSTVQP